MTSRRFSATARPRPSSAIYIGSEAVSPLQSPPSPAHSSSSTRSQLPSPPATNSTGSIGDNNSSGTGSVRRSGMVNGNRQSAALSDEDDDNYLDNDEDDTAKLSNDRRAFRDKQPESSSSTIQRVRSLTERNRKVIDRLSSMTTSDSHSQSSFSTPPTASSSHSRSPVPPAFSSSSSSSVISSISRVASFRGGSGSETEREREQHHIARTRSAPPRDASSDDNDAATPPASTRRITPTFERTGPRQRLGSAPSTPAKPPVPLSPRKHTSTTNFAIIGSGRRSRRVSIQQPGEDFEEEDESPINPNASVSANKRSRAPLPREFRDRKGHDGKDEPTNGRTMQERDRTSPGVFTARGSASANSSGVGGTFTPSPVSPRSQRPPRPSTVRESSRRVHRWNSVDDAAINGDEDGRKQWRHAGSAESPLGGGAREGRSVVGEGLRAAGLARRGSEDVFVDGVTVRRARTSVNGTNSVLQGELDELRRGITRGLGLPLEDPRDPRPPYTASSGSGRFSTSRSNNTIHSVLSGSASRAGTSLGSYAADEEAPRTSQALRAHRTSYGPSGTRHVQSRSSPAVGTFGRGTPQHTTGTPSSEHARLMLDSLSMFEAQLARLPPGTPDIVRAAQSVVQSASGLNTLLRTANTRALEAQIEAEVGDAAALVDASEVWRQVGGEYRETVRVSDELVRTLTALLLGVGRLVREAVKERNSGSPDVSGGGGSGRSSLDGEERDSGPRLRRSMDGDGRQSVERSIYRDRQSRRSWEDGESSQRSHVDLTSRPSTSHSISRGTVRRVQQTSGQDDGEETARENPRPSALERLSIRRIFTPRSREMNQASPQDSPDSSYPSPSPATRSSLDREPRRTLPPLSVPPPLPSLPSESLLERANSIKGRRAKMSNTSNATVRGTSIFPGMTSPPNPTTALTPHTVSAGEVTSFPLLRADTSSSALSGLQQHQQRDVRKRTISAQSLEGSSESIRSSATRALRESRVSVSLDSADTSENQMPHTSIPFDGDRRERRRTINEIFP